MKRNLFCPCLCAVVMSGLLSVSCNKETVTEEVFADVPSLTVDSAVTVSATGGSYSFAYSVTGITAVSESSASEGGTLTASADASWISGIEVSTNSVSFTVAENTSGLFRTANISLRYSYTADGSSRSVTEKTGVVQLGATVPTLSVDPGTLSAPYEGGSFSISYEVEGFADSDYADGDLVCDTDADWIGEFDCSAYGTVNFNVGINYGAELRTGVITMTYSKSGTVLTEKVNVIQDHPDYGSGGNENISDIIGSYSVSGISSTDTSGDGTWTLTVYADTDDDDYDYYIDGLSPGFEGMYNKYGDHRFSARAYFTNGKIVIPAQVSDYEIAEPSGDTYYFGWCACTKYSSGSFYYANSMPDIEFVYDSDSDVWTCGFGVFAAGFADMDLGTLSLYYEATAPGATMTKTGSGSN